ncbi:MAG: deoxyguanosinetriphosphate triphosphohydrolase, partial [Phycicoccus sp.]
GSLAALKDMTSRLIGHFTRVVERATRERYGPDPLGRYAASLVVPADVRAETVVLKAVAAHYVMLAAERAEVYERQREVVAALVAAYEADPGRLDPDLRRDLEQAPDDDAARRVVVDQVASLTDVRALELHARWCRAAQVTVTT